MSFITIVGKAAKQNDVDLGESLKAPLYPPPAHTEPEGNMVRLLREHAVAGQSLGTPAWTARREFLIQKVVEYLKKKARASALAGGDYIPFWMHLGCASPVKAAIVVVDMVAENPKGVLSNLPRVNAKPGVGREGLFNGLLFERLANNHVVLHQDLRNISEAHVGDLNSRLASSSTRLIDVHGLGPDLDPRGTFGPPQRATNWWLSKPRGEGKEAPFLKDVAPAEAYAWKEWLDCAYVSPLIVPGRSKIVYWTISAGLEIKRPAAADSGLSRQIGQMLGRLQASDMVRMTLDGAAVSTPVPARAFIFLPESRWLVGATGSLKNTTDYDFVSTSSGGYLETYLRLRIRFDTTPIDQLTALLFRAVL
ncbi:hypothetical protein PV342_12295 [Streptomyces sp. PA03-3a]|nr:hypothetical protein [Streptomyces sp. PA03-3a]